MLLEIDTAIEVLKKYNQNWTLDSMKDRWEWFYTEAAEILEIDLDDVIKLHQPKLV